MKQSARRSNNHKNKAIQVCFHGDRNKAVTRFSEQVNKMCVSVYI